MVFISKKVFSDLEVLRKGLLKWKIELSEQYVITYISDLIDICYSLDTKTFHFNNSYSKYTKYGFKIHTYKKNRQTQIYFIYNIDTHGNIFINHITSNHVTKKPKYT